MSHAREPRRLVIGIGNPQRGDDGVGHHVVRLLEGCAPADTLFLRESGEGAALVACFERTYTVYLIDAAASGGRPGAIHRFDAAERPLPSGLAEISSHGFGLAQAIELARALGTLPARCIVYLVEAASFEAGAPITPAVAAAAPEVAARILHELEPAESVGRGVCTKLP